MDFASLQGVSVSGIFVILFIGAITTLIKAVKAKNGAVLDVMTAGDKAVMANRIERIETVCEKIVDQQHELVGEVRELTANVNRVVRRVETQPPPTGVPAQVRSG